MKKLIMTAVLAVFTATGAFAETVRLGTEGAYEPWNFVNDAGELDGFEIELGNVENVSWADNVQTRKRRVQVKGFPLVNNRQIIDAGLSGSCRWQEKEAQDCQKKPKT